VANCYVIRLFSDRGYRGTTKDADIPDKQTCVNIFKDFNDRASSVDTQGQCVKLYEHGDCQGRSIRVGPDTPSHDDLSQLQFDNMVSAVGDCELMDSEGDDAMATPPETWQENWGRDNGFVVDHRDLLYRQYYDDDIAVYFDANVDRNATWMRSYMGDAWRYIKREYGPFGKGRFYLVYHAGKTGMGIVCQPGYYLKRNMGYRSALDCISGSPDSWRKGTDLEIEMAVHEMAHVVESSFGGVIESPAFEIWRDSKWAEIFMYDVYKAIGDERHATAWFNAMTSPSRNLRNERLTYNKYPAPGTNWFRDFFYPVYNQYGGVRVLRAFFQNLVDNFPRKANGKEYARRMNMGEFVHYWSGAAGVDVLPLIRKTFNWDKYPEFQQQLDKAKQDFSAITYKQANNVWDGKFERFNDFFDE
jgi:hypothetical protein